MRRSSPISGPARSTEAPAIGRAALDEAIAERARVVEGFFQREAGRLARACHEMARAFARGGTLIPLATGPAATDAAHAAVEFMHPVIVGKRALPAVAPSNDLTSAVTLSRIAGPDDIALAISHGPRDPQLARFLEAARARGLLTIELAGGGSAEPLPGMRSETGGAAYPLGSSGYRFEVPSDDPEIVQEVQETTYHVLWELVHVFFEQPGLLDGADEDGAACITCGDVAITARVAEVRGVTAVIEKDGATEEVAVDLIGEVKVGDELLCHAGVALERVGNGSGEPPQEASAGDPTDFLYPFQSSEPKTELDWVIFEVQASTLAKAGEVTALRSVIDTRTLARCAALLRERLLAGGRLIAFGNGGSATDAQDVATDALALGWAAIALNNDAATVTAVANDVGFEQVFARQLIALGRPGDVALAISTSGSSSNLITAIAEAHSRGMTTVALAGYDGGRLADLDALDHLFVIPSDQIPRIQEAQATTYHLLLQAIGDRSPATGDRSPGGER